MPRVAGFITFLILATFMSGCSFSLTGDITPPPGSQLPAIQEATQPVTAKAEYPIVPPDLTNGKNIYTHECVRCHGEKGLGDGPQAAQLSVPVATLGLSDFARQYAPTEWYTVVSQGTKDKFMPAFPNLTDRQRWDVVAYAISLSSPETMISQGKVLYESKCANCHGLTGKGNGPDATTLTGLPTDFTDQALMAQSSANSFYQAINNGIIPDMPAFTSTLDDNQRWSLVSYLRSLTFTISSPAANAELASASNSTATQTLANPYPGPTLYPAQVLTQTPSLSSTSTVTPTVTFLGSVTVQLINGSGGVTPSDSPVILYGFDNMQNTYSETLSTGANGVYTFTNVIMPTGRVFLAGTKYASGTYGSDVVTVDPAKPNLNLQITVYDSTTDISLLTVDRVHIFFDFTDPQNVQVIEVFIISNPSKQAVVSASPDGTVVTFPLPSGFSNLQFQDGALGSRYVALSQGFADKMTVNPGVGQYQVIFAFQLPYNRKLDFAQNMFLPTSAVVVMVPDNGIKLSSGMLQDGGTQAYQGTTYRLFNGTGLIAGTDLSFTLSGSPKKGGTSLFTTGTMQNLAIGLGVFGVALVMAGIWLFRRNRNNVALQSAAADSDEPASLVDLEAGPEDEGTLMDAIIALDDQYHSGNLPEEAYLERRALLKEKLRKLDQG